MPIGCLEHRLSLFYVQEIFSDAVLKGVNHQSSCLDCFWFVYKTLMDPILAFYLRIFEERKNNHLWHRSKLFCQMILIIRQLLVILQIEL